MGGSSFLNAFDLLQYKPGTSFLHGLDARTKLASIGLLIVGALVVPNMLSYAALAVLLVFATIAGRVNPIIVWRAFGLALILVAIGAVILAIIIPGTVAFRIGPIGFTKPGVALAERGSAEALIILYAGVLLVVTTAPTAFAQGLVWYLRPLARFRVPVDEIAIMVSLGLAFLPQLQAELARILLAQRVRGADYRRAPLEARILSALAILPPLLASNLRRAEELAIAMEARGYVPGARRTQLKSGQFRRGDLVSIVVAISGLGAAFIL